ARRADRSGIVAYRGSSGSRPTTGANLRHRPWLATPIWIGPSLQRNVPYGAIDGWSLPADSGTSRATVQRVPWNMCAPTTDASSDVRTTAPRPVRSRSYRAASTPATPLPAARMSAIDRPTLLGVPGGPVTL